jgi:hypothetical protein
MRPYALATRYLWRDRGDEFAQIRNLKDIGGEVEKEREDLLLSSTRRYSA